MSTDIEAVTIYPSGSVDWLKVAWELEKSVKNHCLLKFSLWVKSVMKKYIGEPINNSLKPFQGDDKCDVFVKTCLNMKIYFEEES